MISVAHEKGSLNAILAILGNDIAVKALRDGTRPFPDGAIIARIAWQYEYSAEDDAVLGKPQSFVAGAPTNVQLSVVDRKRYADTGVRLRSIENGKPNHDEALMRTCASCHAHVPKADDFVFTHYAP